MMLNEGPKPPQPQEFADALSQTDGYELAAAESALAQSHHPQVRAFAQWMLADHAQTARALRDAAKASGLELPHPHVGGDQARFLGSLQSLRDNEFDREYCRQQMLAHTSALTMMRSYAEKGSDTNLRRIAASSIPIVEGHLQMARELLQSFM